MQAEDRENWLVAAFEEVREIPAMIFADACKHARRVADHPAKIVPAIHGYKPDYDSVGVYRERLWALQRRLENLNAPRLSDFQSREPCQACGIRANEPRAINCLKIVKELCGLSPDFDPAADVSSPR